jgi:hypothetical protein
MLNGGPLPRSFVAKRRNLGFRLGRAAGSRARRGSGFLKTLKDPEFVAEAEKPSMQACVPQRKAPVNPHAEGLAGEPVAILEAVATWDHRR